MFVFVFVGANIHTLFGVCKYFVTFPLFFNKF
nr:MAG TPA: hypothetical protein [Caudoviricetes sp.]